MFKKFSGSLILILVIMLSLLFSVPAFASSPVNIKVTPDSIVLQPGKSQNVKVEVVYPDGKISDVTRSATYQADNTKIVSANRGGQITAKSPGMTTITVKSHSLTATIEVTVAEEKGVKEPAQEQQQNTTTEPVQGQQSEKPVVQQTSRQQTPSNPQPAVIEPKSRQVEQSENPTVQTPSRQEKIPQPETLTVTPSNINLSVKESQEITATLTFSDGTVKDVSRDAVWIVSNSNVASVQNGHITALSPGSTTIIMKSYGKTATINVTVRENYEIPKPVSLDVDPKNVTIKPGESVKIRADLTFSDGTVKDVFRDAVWIIDNVNVAKVQNGQIIALSPGTTDITIKSYGKTAVIKVSVTKDYEMPQPVRLEINPQTITLQPGESVKIDAYLTFSDGTVKDVSRNAVFIISNSSVIKVNSGFITGISPGTSSITMRSYGLSEVINVIVKEPLDEEEPGEEEPGEDDSNRAVPAVLYGNGAASKDLQWQYNGINYTWHIEAPQGLIQHSQNIYELTRTFYESDAYTQQQMLQNMTPDMRELVLASAIDNQGNLIPWVNEPQNVQYIKRLAQSLQEQAQADGLSYFQAAEFVLKFVQAIPYKEHEYLRLPVQTVLEGGDCDGKSVLFAALLREMGYTSALLYFASGSTPGAGHMAVGVAFSDEQRPQRDYPMVYYNHAGKKFYAAETTGSRNIGERIGYTITKIYVVE